MKIHKLKEIPYHIIFLLEYDRKYQTWTAHKEEITSGGNAFKVGTCYHTDWLSEQELSLKVDSLSIDKVYKNFVWQIAGDALILENTETLIESVERDMRRQEIQKQITALQAKVHKEKQLNKQMQLNAELKRLKKEWEVLL